jgi:hypothetical protein
MSSSLSRQIRQRLRELTSEEISSTEFRHWFHPVAWSIDEANDPVAEDLVYEIEEALAEFDSGAWTEHELHRALTVLAHRSDPIVLDVGNTDPPRRPQ